VCVPLPGLKPCEYSKKCGSYIGSTTICIARWITLSLGDVTNNLRILPFFLGIFTILAGENLNFPACNNLLALSILNLLYPSRVSFVYPLVRLLFFRLI
jgi:hypothetical protein